MGLGGSRFRYDGEGAPILCYFTDGRCRFLRIETDGNEVQSTEDLGFLKVRGGNMSPSLRLLNKQGDPPLLAVAAREPARMGHSYRSAVSVTDLISGEVRSVFRTRGNIDGFVKNAFRCGRDTWALEPFTGTEYVLTGDQEEGPCIVCSFVTGSKVADVPESSVKRVISLYDVRSNRLFLGGAPESTLREYDVSRLIESGTSKGIQATEGIIVSRNVLTQEDGFITGCVGVPDRGLVAVMQHVGKCVSFVDPRSSTAVARLVAGSGNLNNGHPNPMYYASDRNELLVSADAKGKITSIDVRDLSKTRGEMTALSGGSDFDFVSDIVRVGGSVFATPCTRHKIVQVKRSVHLWSPDQGPLLELPRVRLLGCQLEVLRSNGLGIGKYDSPRGGGGGDADVVESVGVVETEEGQAVEEGDE